MSELPRPATPFVDVDVSFGNRLARMLWGIVETMLYRPSPRLAHGWRRMLLRLFGARIGKHVHPYPRTRIWAPWNLVMDEGSSIDNDVTCLNNTLLHLGAWSAVSQQSFLCTASRDIDRPGRPVTGAPITSAPAHGSQCSVLSVPGLPSARMPLSERVQRSPGTSPP